MYNYKLRLVLLLTVWQRLDTEAFGFSSFGKANTDSPTPITTTPSPARQCSRQGDCLGISSTSCVRTHYDMVTRCLCGDNQPPLNGQCEATIKTLYHMCSNNNDCNDGLICGTPNITGPMPVHLRVNAPTDKICLCDGDSGFVEKDHSCSDADILKTSVFAIVVVTFIRKFVY